MLPIVYFNNVSFTSEQHVFGMVWDSKGLCRLDLCIKLSSKVTVCGPGKSDRKDAVHLYVVELN